jgi:3-Ketosteroid 9alpha-hydroxylase C-terminal domain
VKSVTSEVGQDIPIWENKRYEPNPALAPSERPITEFRRWFKQFYDETPAPASGSAGMSAGTSSAQ